MGDRQAFPRGIFGARDRGGRTITVGARLVLSALWSFARWWDDDPAAMWVFPTTATLARMTGQHERSVWRQLEALSAAGWICRERRVAPGGGRFDGWTLVRPPDPLTEAPGIQGPQATLDLSEGPGSTLAEGPPRPGPSDPDPLTEGPDRRSTEESRQDPRQDQTVDPGEVIEYLRKAVHSLTGDKSTGPRNAQANREMIRKATKREGADLEAWKRVIDAQLDSVRGDPSTWQYLCLSTITRPGNFARLHDAPRGAGRGRSARHAPSSFDSTELGGLFDDTDLEEIPI